jgi:hypothetical protein
MCLQQTAQGQHQPGQIESVQQVQEQWKLAMQQCQQDPE